MENAYLALIAQNDSEPVVYLIMEIVLVFKFDLNDI